MLLAIHRNGPNRVWATHKNSQLEDVAEAYPAAEFGIYRTVEHCRPTEDVPDAGDYEVVRAVPPSEAAP